MGRHYSTRDFLRQMPNALLARYFQVRGVLHGFNFASLKETQPEPLLAALNALPEAQRNPMVAEFREIQGLSDEKGVRAIIDEAEFHLGAGTGGHKQFVQGLALLPNHIATVVDGSKRAGLIVPGSPAVGVVCPGCEQQCFMPVHIHLRHDGSSATFVLCDKRSDTSRVRVPPEDLELWQSSGEAVAAMLALHLNIHRSSGTSASADRWEVGLLKGKQHSAHVVLLADGDLRLEVAGHTLALADVLELDGEQIIVNKPLLTSLVDQPRDGAGSVESAQQRRSRLKKRVTEEKLKGTKGFLKVVAAEEDMSVSRLKQLLDKA